MNGPPPPDPKHPLSGVDPIIARNIQALVEHNRREVEERSLQQRVADAITRFSGSMPFVYVHLAIYGMWIVINLGWIPFMPKFDPTFVVLAMVASVEAIFLSTFILITQNRMAQIAERRADLDLQISLLAEHEVTRLITMVREIAARMQLPAAQNPELTELQKDVDPERVLDALEKHQKETET